MSSGDPSITLAQLEAGRRETRECRRACRALRSPPCATRPARMIEQGGFTYMRDTLPGAELKAILLVKADSRFFALQLARLQ